jgi:hypothetical protein
MAHDVFVSHSVKDKATAEKIVAHLERDSIRCWVAPRDVVPGADWGESIIDAIESSRVMVLIFSAHANGSSQIKREVERAVDKDVYTIPFRIDDIEPTRSLEYFISSSQWMDAFTPPLETHLEKLSRTIKAILAKPATAAATSATPSPRRFDDPPALIASPVPAASSSSWPKITMIAAALIILGLVSLLVLNWQRLGSSTHAGVPNAAPARAPVKDEAAPPVTYGIELKPNAADSNVANPANIRASESPPLNTWSAPTPEPIESIAPAYSRKSAFEAPNPPLNVSKNYAAPIAEDPAAVVRRYYDAINRRDLKAAYDSFSQSFKGRRSYDQYAQIFAATRSIKLRQAEETKRGDNDADVSVAFAEVDAENRTHQWEGHVLLVKEGDAWRISQMPVKQRVAPAKAN